jgi:hypothetical protein
MKYWEIIADNLKKRGWSYGYVSAIDSQGRTIWIVHAHRGDGKRFVVRADVKLTAFLELESAIRAFSPAFSALPERWRQIEALAFALHEHGTLDGEAMKLIRDRSADVGCYRWSNAW